MGHYVNSCPIRWKVLTVITSGENVQIFFLVRQDFTYLEEIVVSKILGFLDLQCGFSQWYWKHQTWIFDCFLIRSLLKFWRKLEGNSTEQFKTLFQVTVSYLAGGKGSGIFEDPNPVQSRQRMNPPGGKTSDIFGSPVPASPVRAHPNKPKVFVLLWKWV